MKTSKEKIEGLIRYYKKMINTESMADIAEKVNEFGSKTLSKVQPLVTEAHNHGIILGLHEAIRILELEEGKQT